MSKLAIALIIIQVVCLIGVVLFIRMDYKKKHPPMCENCKALISKRLGMYDCGHRTNYFRVCPKICCYYRAKEGADHA